MGKDPSAKQSASELYIDIDAIPQYVWDQLSAAALDLFHSILRQPGGREALDACIAAREAAAAARKGADKHDT